ncbi:MAG: hypothetical protein LBQ48_00900, partial [Oscillospiraceae bacterium]|nr:hypothetical protein [Oscillospiraceae bacterium]
MKAMKVLRLCTALVTVAALFCATDVSGLERQTAYQYDEKGVSIPAPAAYAVERVWVAQNSGTSALSEPADLFVDREGMLYIADTGNSRVLILDGAWTLLSEIKTVWLENEAQSLQNPQGVFMGTDGLLYICDTGNRRVIAVDGQSKIRREILGRDLTGVRETYDFKPERVSVDSLGNIYVVSSSIYQGIMCFSADGVFRSFFAPNEVENTLSTWLLSLWKSVFTDKQKENVEKSLPEPYNNLYIDADDFIYTTAPQAGEGGDLKKNNLMGVNILKSAHNLGAGERFGDAELTVKDGKAAENALADVHVDGEGVISVLDANTNRVYQYTQECDLIAIFGGSGSLKGQFTEVSALEKWEASYLVLDRQDGSVTVFSPCAYIENVRGALKCYNLGLYQEAETLWEKVLNENGGMTLAYRGMGRAALQQNEVTKAMQYLDKGADKYFYSIA